jgi:hypothetical protein
MTEEIKRLIKKAFYNYLANKNTAAEYISDHAEDGFAIDYTRIPVHVSGNSQENRMIKMLSEEEKKYRWCRVVEKTIDYFYMEDCRRDDFIRYRFFQYLTFQQIAQKMYIDESTAKRWINEVYFRAEIAAVKLGLI